MIYEGFAAVYDSLMGDVNYDEWARYYLQMARRNGTDVRRAADCACGTGNLTLALARQGIQMTGLDISMEMLQIAGQKARAAGLSMPFVRQDMRRLLLHRPMDAVFCACDGVNYLTQPQDVCDFFRAAFKALRPGGALLFDVSTQYKLSTILANNSLANDGEDVAYLWQNHYSPASRLVQMDLTFFVREADSRYRRFGETHFQRAHTAQELSQWLRDAGFGAIAFWGDKTFSAPDAHTQRMHVAAIRPDQQEEL